MINGIGYFGRRQCNCLPEEDDYLGSGKLLKMAIDKYGKENFKKTILCECDSLEELYQKEEEYIERFNAVYDYHYYNIDFGGAPKSEAKLDEYQIRKYVCMKKQIEASESVKYYLKVDRIGSLDGKISPCMSIGKSTSFSDGRPTHIEYLTIYNNIKGKEPDIKSSITCHEYSKEFSGYDQSADRWLKRKGYVNVDEKDYNIYYNRFGHANDIALKSFDDIEECLKEKRRKEIAEATEIKAAAVDNVVADTERIKDNVVDMEVCNSEAIPGKVPNKKRIRKSNPFDILGYIKENAAPYNSYYYLLKLHNEYGKDFTLPEIFNAVSNHSSIQEDYLKNGFICSKSKYYKTREALNYLMNFKDITGKISGNKSFLNMVINFCYNCKSVDNNELNKKLHKVFNNQYKSLPPIKSINKLSDAATYIDKVYNYLSKNKVDVVDMFNKRT